MSVQTVDLRPGDIIFFGTIPAYMGRDVQLAEKVNDFYINFTQGNLDEALKLFLEFSIPIQKKLLQAKDAKGFSFLHKLTLNEQNQTAIDIIQSILKDDKKKVSQSRL